VSFTEICCRSGGSNLNAGSLNGDSTIPGTAANFTWPSGSWDEATGVFTVTSGNPSGDGVAVGNLASIYDNAASQTTQIGRITAVSTSTITVSRSAKCGTTTNGSGNRTLKVGGALQGPNGSNAFPFGLITNALTVSAGYLPRVSMKNDQTHAVSAAMTHGNAGVAFEGFASSYGDGGCTTIDGGSTGAAYVLMTLSGNDCGLKNLKFARNGATSAASLVVVSGSRVIVERCVFTGSKGNGLNSSVAIDLIVRESEFYSNAAAGFAANSVCFVRRCFSLLNGTTGFDNAGSNSTMQFDRCVAILNTGRGFFTTGVGTEWNQCDAWYNGSHGFDIAGTSNRLWVAIAENCNALKNGGYGIAQSSDRGGRIYNCGIGSGSQANASGGIQSGNIMDVGTITYAPGETPWADPAAGDFRIALAAAKAAGRGAFLQTAPGYAGTIGHLDVGAGQHIDAGAGGIVTPHGIIGPEGILSL